MKAETEPKNATYKLSRCNCFSFSSQELIKVCSEHAGLSPLSYTKLKISSPIQNAVPHKILQDGFHSFTVTNPLKLCHLSPANQHIFIPVSHLPRFWSFKATVQEQEIIWNKTDYFLLHDIWGIVILTAFKQHYLFIRNKKTCCDLLPFWELDPFAFLFSSLLILIYL